MSIKKSFISGKNVYQVTFSHPASAVSGKNKVVVLGDFNHWDNSKGLVLKSGKTGFTASVELAAGTYEFRYLIDNTTWENDHNADGYTSSPFAGIQNSVLYLPAVEAKQGKEKSSAPSSEKSMVAKKATPAISKAAKSGIPVIKKSNKEVEKTVLAPAKAVTVKTKPTTKAEPKVAAKSTKK